MAGSLYPDGFSRNTFALLTIVAIFMLQGFSFATGSGWDMCVAIWKGEFSNGQPLYEVYTGIAPVDYALSMSVSFWTPLLREFQATRLEAAMLCASLQALSAWATIERFRSGNNGSFWRWLPLYMFSWQYFGTAMLLPFYLYKDLVHQFGTSDVVPSPRISYLKAKSLLPALGLALLFPYRMVYFTPVDMTEETFQTHIALYQLSPFVSYALIAAFVQLQREDDKSVAETDLTHDDKDAPWIKIIYAVFGVFSFVVHVGIVVYAMTGLDQSVSLRRLFVPEFSRLWASEAPLLRYAEEKTYFLQWDYIIIVLACAIYITRILANIYNSAYISWSPLGTAPILLVAGIISAAIGPGATVSATLYLREDYLRARHSAQERQSKDLSTALANKTCRETGE